MALSGIMSFLNLKNVEIYIIPPKEAFAKKPTSLYIQIKRKYFLDLFILKINILNKEVVIPHVKKEKIFQTNIVFPKRGKNSVSDISVSSYFPFYFFKRSVPLNIKFDIVVFPYPLKCNISSLFSDEKVISDSVYSKGKAFEGEITGVRQYSTGDPLKFIHWKATAKTEELKTKELSPPAGKPVIVSLSDFSGDIENKLSQATYALIKIIKNGNPVGLKLGKDFYKPDASEAHLRRMLYALAVYTPEQN